MLHIHHQNKCVVEEYALVFFSTVTPSLVTNFTFSSPHWYVCIIYVGESYSPWDINISNSIII